MIKKALLLVLTLGLLVSCQKEDANLENSADSTLQTNRYDNSNLGIYKGIFTTADSKDRGTIEINVIAEKHAIATLTMVNGDIYLVKSATTVLENTNISDLVFTNRAVSFKFSVEANGANPKITDVTFGQRAAMVQVAKNTSRAPVLPITGTYVVTAGSSPHFGLNPQTFSMLYVGAGTGTDTFATQIILNGNDYGSPATSNNQNSCETKATHIICQISGTSTTVGGNPITYTGNHVSATGVTPDCSLVYGTWSYTSAAFGVISGTFLNDNSCPIPANDLCENAIPIACGGSATGSTITSTTFGNPPACVTSQGIVGSVWFQYADTGVAGTMIQVTLCPNTITTYDSKIAVYTGSCGAANLVCVIDNDDFCTLASQVTFPQIGDGTTTYYIRVFGFSDEAGAYGISVTCTTPPPPAGCDPGNFGGSGATGALTDNNCPAVNSFVYTETTPGIVGTTASINKVQLSITHSWDSDLDISLLAPDGITSLDLSVNNGGSGDNYTNTVFQDGGADITAGTAPFTGTFQPEGGTFAAAFAGQNVNGNWTLQICDGALGDIGPLTQYIMCFDPIPAPIAAPAQKPYTRKNKTVNKAAEKAKLKALKGNE